MSIRSTIGTAVYGLAALLAFGTAPLMAAEKTAHPTAETGAYVDIWDYLPTWQQQDGWLDTTYWLKRNFNDICGDTFCEGEYANLEALSYRCSADSGNGTVGQCAWILAGSVEHIDRATGKVIAEPNIWQCASPLAPGTDAEELAQALANTQPLFAKLPHTDKTLYDGLVDCFFN